MSYRTEKGVNGKEEIVLHGVENGIAPSPHSGIANIQCANLDSFVGEAGVNYDRTNTLPAISSGSLSGGSNLEYVYGSKDKLVIGSCIVPSNSSITNLTNGKPYWITSISDTGTVQNINASASYGGVNVSFGSTGSATFNTFTLHKFVQSALEYRISDNKYVYYMCDSTGVVWANDPAVYGVFSPTGDTNGTSIKTNFSTPDITGFGVTQGVAYVFAGDAVYANQTNTLGVYRYSSSTNQGWRSVLELNTPGGATSASHYALSVPDQNGSLYYCDSQWIGQISSVASDTAGTGRFVLMEASCDGSTPTITISSYIQGVVPGSGLPIAIVAVVGGSIPTGLTASTQYYVKTGSYNQSTGTFQIATSASGSAITPSSAGSFYVTSFIPDPAFTAIVAYTKQSAALPYYAESSCLEYVTQGAGITIYVGTTGRGLYSFSPGSSGLIGALLLPEPGTQRLLNVDNVLYAFAGNKGNIYISNGANLAGALSIPDYCANVDGSNQDPPFVWGDVMFLRGRVWFSIQDQTSSHTGNCGGVWSFIPTQNLFIGQDQGIRLRLENKSSYGTYNGRCTVLLPSMNQDANGPQYWSGWSSDYGDATSFGIDFSSTSPYTGGQTIIDWDLIPVGTFLPPWTPSNIEYKIARPLVSGESVSIYYRTNLKDSFTLIGTDSTVGNTAFPFTPNFDGVQWLQLRTVQTAVASNSSFVPITELRIRS